MRRYWIPQDQISENSSPYQVEISGETFHHIFDVCRQEKGSRFEVLGKDQKAHLIEVLTVEKKKAFGKIIESRQIPPLPKPHLVLALSIPRFPVMEAVIEKATELGVKRIQPFYSEFSFIRNSQSLSESKEERWKKIVVSATQQSGRGDLMEISKPVNFDEVIEQFNQSSPRMGLFAYEGPSTLGIKKQLQLQVQSQDFENLNEFWLFVGSEGGFSSTEVEQFHQIGLDPVTLGDQILRVETACITLLAVLKYQFGQMEVL